MEFRFRAGDDRPSSSSSSSSSSAAAAASSSWGGYFREQAMRAGLLGSGGGARPPPSPFECEAMRLERIRQEVERRLIEEEVRRELEVELALARRLHRGLAHDAFMPPSPQPSFEEFGAWEGFRRFGPRGRVGFGFGQRLLVEEGKKWSPSPAVPKHKVELREMEPSESSEVPSSEPKVTGTKRKADAIAAATAPMKLQKPAQDWSCAICQVSATSEAGLNEHLEGKKHRAKLVQCGAIKITNDEKNSLKATIGNKNGTAPGDVPKKISIHVDGAMHEVVQRNNYLWCERCRVGCDNNMTMVGHLRGKKHRELNKVWTAIKAVRMNANKNEDSAATAENKVNETGPVEVAKEIKIEGRDMADAVAPLVPKKE